MAEIAVINKDNQDYDIRDKKLADASTASTVASGDAITLKTTAGTYVEIDRNSFVSAIRDVLGASIKSNTGGTSDVNTLPALTSSGALKSISTSDIASVLGVGGVKFVNGSSWSPSGIINTQFRVPGVGGGVEAFSYFIIISWTQNAEQTKGVVICTVETSNVSNECRTTILHNNGSPLFYGDPVFYVNSGVLYMTNFYGNCHMTGIPSGYKMLT